MIIFDLVCQNSHTFEGWFRDLADLEGQLNSGSLFCPVCGDTHITRRPSAFGIGRSKSPPANAPAAPGPPGGPRREAMDPEAAGFMERLETLSARLREDFADVGAGFTAEALKMHYGAAPRRNIRGMSTEPEDEMLRSEGIDFFKVPMLVRKSPAAS
jgi:hypothetical protein